MNPPCLDSNNTIPNMSGINTHEIRGALMDCGAKLMAGGFVLAAASSMLGMKHGPLIGIGLITIGAAIMVAVMSTGQDTPRRRVRNRYQEAADNARVR